MSVQPSQVGRCSPAAAAGAAAWQGPATAVHVGSPACCWPRAVPTGDQYAPISASWEALHGRRGRSVSAGSMAEQGLPSCRAVRACCLPGFQSGRIKAVAHRRAGQGAQRRVPTSLPWQYRWMPICCQPACTSPLPPTQPACLPALDAELHLNCTYEFVTKPLLFVGGCELVDVAQGLTGEGGLHRLQAPPQGAEGGGLPLGPDCEATTCLM